jgi:hypothetical protein
MREEFQDAYLDLMLEEEARAVAPPDLTERVVRALESARPDRRRFATIAAGFALFALALWWIVRAPRAPLEGLSDTEIVDRGEAVVAALQAKGRHDLVRKIRWAEDVLSRDEVFDRLRKHRVNPGDVPATYGTPEPTMAALSRATGVPILLQQGYRDTEGRNEIGRESTAYTVLDDILRRFGLSMEIVDGGVYVGRGAPTSRKQMAATLLETLHAREEDRRVAAAKILSRLAPDMRGFNPYGSEARRRDAASALVEWWKAQPDGR